MRDSRAYCECAKHTNKRQMSDKPLSLPLSLRDSLDVLSQSLSLSLSVSLICFISLYNFDFYVQKEKTIV